MMMMMCISNTSKCISDTSISTSDDYYYNNNVKYTVNITF